MIADAFGLLVVPVVVGAMLLLTMIVKPVVNFLAAFVTGVATAGLFLLFFAVWMAEEDWRTPHLPFLVWLYRGAVGKGS